MSRMGRNLTVNEDIKHKDVSKYLLKGRITDIEDQVAYAKSLVTLNITLSNGEKMSRIEWVASAREELDKLYWMLSQINI